MNRIWKFIIIGIVLACILYLKYIHPVASKFIVEYEQIKTIVNFLIFYLVVILLSKVAKSGYSRRYKIPRGKKNNVHFGIENLSNFIIGVGFLLMLLSVFGIDPREMITSVTIVAAAFVILTKEYIVDFLSGIFLSFSNTFEIGDYVKLENREGKIVEISMLKVKILNDNDDIVIIPNSKAYYGEIINYTKRDARLMVVDFQIALKYIENIAELEKEIIEALKGFSEYIEPNSYNIKVVEMKMDYIGVKFQYTLKQVDPDLHRKIRKGTIREIFNLVSSKKEIPALK